MYLIIKRRIALRNTLQLIIEINNNFTKRDIINNLKKVAGIIVQREAELQKRIFEAARDDIEDKVWRSYGILKNARKISAKEAMQMISIIMEGKNMGVKDIPECTDSLIDLIINIQPASLQMGTDMFMLPNDRDRYRAEYIRNRFK